MSHLFGATLRQSPAGTEAPSHQLLLRAGFIRQLGQELFSYLPLAVRAMAKIEAILRSEMEAIGGQEMRLPVTHPAEIWKASGRWSSVGSELLRFKDRRDRDMVLAMTHEEVVAQLAQSEIKSYRQLPQLVYQIQTKFRDDPRPRAGLIRVREFTMKDSYSLDLDEDGLDQQYWTHYRAYFSIFDRCALPTIAVGSDVGMMGGSAAHEFMYLNPVGEDTLVLCDHCGYAANRQVAKFSRTIVPPEIPLPIERVPTPNASSVAALAQDLNVSQTRVAKAMFLAATVPGDDSTNDRVVVAVLRGDLQLNETKLANALGATDLRPATDLEITNAGSVPGFGSPVGLTSVTVVVDESVTRTQNLIAGANEEGFHFRNVNVPRDFAADITTDIAAASDGDECSVCSYPLRTARGIEVGNIFKLGTKYSLVGGAVYLDIDGRSRPIVMGSYGIGVGRLLACIAEEHHDDHGLKWPVTVAPYLVHLLGLDGSQAEVSSATERLYDQLNKANMEVLYDDRSERAGVKFVDADLIGLPLRVTVSRRTLATSSVELQRRDDSEPTLVPVDEIVAHISAQLDGLYAALADRVAARVLPSTPRETV